MTHRAAVFALCALAGMTLTLEASRPVAAANEPSIIVSYRDLDLSQPADARVLYTRLVRAAATVCPAAPTYELARFAAYQRCVKEVLGDAVQRVHSAALDQVANPGTGAIARVRSSERR